MLLPPCRNRLSNEDPPQLTASAILSQGIMKKLNDAEILKLMREEWDAKVKRFAESVDVLFKSKVDGKESTIIDKDLKYRHKKSQYLYTVVSVSPREVILKTPEGDEFLVDKDTLEDEYELD